MDIKETANELYVEIYATNNEGKTMIIKEVIGEEGEHETYMNIYNKLMNMGKGPPIVTGKQIGRASCRERVSSPV